jgi:hypothetical protein
MQMGTQIYFNAGGHKRKSKDNKGFCEKKDGRVWEVAERMKSVSVSVCVSEDE